MKTRRCTVALLAAVVVLVSASCGDAPARWTAPVGKAYVATGGQGIDLPAASHLRIEFGTDRLAVSGGCNSIGGAYSLEHGVLVAEGGWSQTEMACDEPLMALDRAVIDLLSAGPTVDLQGDVLTITSGDVVLTLREEAPAADLPLEGTTWTVVGLVSGDTVSSVAVSPTLRIHDGRVDVFTGCNKGSAPVTVEEASLSVGELIRTATDCAPDVMTVEWAVEAVLHGTVDYRIEGTRLELRNGSLGLDLAG